MTVLVTPDEMQAAEDSTIASGTSALVLMRRAAEAIATWIDRHVPQRADIARTAVAFVGPGNNGGDALVALALLHERGWTSRVILFDREHTKNLPASHNSLASIDRIELGDIGIPDVILDGVYGFRSRPSLPDAVSKAFSVARNLRRMYSVPLVAIDVPSGIDAGTGEAATDAFPADVTLCLGLPKLGVVRGPAAEFVGELELLPIGISPPELPIGRPRMITEDVVRSLLPRRAAFAYKHDTGTAMIVGGAATYFGAPRLAAEAAARSGAGLVCVAAPHQIVPVIASQIPEAVFLPLDDSDGRASAKDIIAYLDQRSTVDTALVVGPGLGRSDRATMLLDELFEWLGSRPAAETPRLTIDADGLNWLSTRGRIPFGIADSTSVLTPHAGELARLLKSQRQEILHQPVELAVEAAAQYRQIVVLKLGYSIVADPLGSVWYAPRSTPELATAGTGDVLAGLIGGLAAQGMDPLDAALAAMFVGTQAGKHARHRQGTLGVTARDVIDHIPGALSALIDSRLISCIYP